MTASALAALLAVAQSPSAAPVFSRSGPDAADYGEAESFPIGTQHTFTEARCLVGAFSHFDQLFPAHMVPRAATPWMFRRAPKELAVSYPYEGATRSIADYLARHPVTGLLIAKDDEILFEHYQYDRTDRDRLLSQSMGKTLVGMLIGIAVADHAIASIDDPAAAYVSELEGTEYGKTSIRDLLHMASGVRFEENYGGQDDDERFEEELLFGKGAKTPAAIVAQFNTRVAPPGTRWAYASIESYLLGLVLRAATDRPVAAYLREKIWQPIGAEADASWIVDGSGQEMTHGFFSAVLRDWARLARLLAHDGEWQGRQLIPRQWVLDATTVSTADQYLKGVVEGIDYGYQVWILPGPRRMFALLGTRGQRIFVDPAAKLVMVNLAVRKKFADDPGVYETGALWAALVRQLGQ